MTAVACASMPTGVVAILGTTYTVRNSDVTPLQPLLWAQHNSKSYNYVAAWCMQTTCCFQQPAGSSSNSMQDRLQTPTASTCPSMRVCYKTCYKTLQGHFYDVEELDRLVTQKNKETGWELGIHVDAASGGFVAPFAFPEMKW
jgi:glutamate/tyrosine decarboxylase-like PLP-dependent enzyme